MLKDLTIHSSQVHSLCAFNQNALQNLTHHPLFSAPPPPLLCSSNRDVERLVFGTQLPRLQRHHHHHRNHHHNHHPNYDDDHHPLTCTSSPLRTVSLQGPDEMSRCSARACKLAISYIILVKWSCLQCKSLQRSWLLC